jgi:hypothetical protein
LNRAKARYIGLFDLRDNHACWSPEEPDFSAGLCEDRMSRMTIPATRPEWQRMLLNGGRFSASEPMHWCKLIALAMPPVLTAASSLYAQDALNELKAKIWEAEVAQRNFAAGLPHCSELNGTNFYFYQRNRVLNLQDYRRSLDNLVMQGAFNPETRRPWTKQDADARWAQVQKQAATDQANCAAAASLPGLRKELQELQQRPSSTPADAAKK